MEDAWIVIVEPLPREAAERALAAWLQQQAEQGVTYNADKIRTDTIRSEDGRDLVRFLVGLPPDLALCYGADELPTLFDRLKSVAGKAKGLPADLAINHDHYLHGQSKRQ